MGASLPELLQHLLSNYANKRAKRGSRGCLGPGDAYCDYCEPYPLSEPDSLTSGRDGYVLWWRGGGGSPLQIASEHQVLIIYSSIIDEMAPKRPAMPHLC